MAWTGGLNRLKSPPLFTTLPESAVPERLAQIHHWLRHDLGLADYEITPASADASFRRYFRVQLPEESRIVMDAPPEREDSHPFVTLARRLRAIGLHVPEIYAEALDRGFLLLSDLGTRQYLDELNPESVERLYGDALGALAALQACGPQAGELPPYDRALLAREMALFRDWLLVRHLGLTLSEAEEQMLERLFERLIENALEQPQVAVHRDYHSRNLMVNRHNPGILDFQDAVWGPVTYDLVSLLRDAYIAWPRAQVEGWVVGYHDLALDHGILQAPAEAQFLRWFDLMGLQRHLKVAGIFARLNHRDGKAGYLKDIPRTVGYLQEVAADYGEMAPLAEFIAERVMPRL